MPKHIHSKPSSRALIEADFVSQDPSSTRAVRPAEGKREEKEKRREEKRTTEPNEEGKTETKETGKEDKTAKRGGQQREKRRSRAREKRGREREEEEREKQERQRERENIHEHDIGRAPKGLSIMIAAQHLAPEIPFPCPREEDVDEEDEQQDDVGVQDMAKDVHDPAKGVDGIRDVGVQDMAKDVQDPAKGVDDILQSTDP